MQTMTLPPNNINNFAEARSIAVSKARETIAEPVIVAWKDDNSGQFAPEIPGGSAGRWHDYGESNEGALELQVGNAYHFIFIESAGFEEPDLNLTSLEDNGTQFLCLNGACTEADKMKRGYFAGGGLDG